MGDLPKHRQRCAITHNLIVAGPWFHGQWQTPKGEKIGEIPLGHDSAREFSEQIEAPFLRYYLHGEGEKFSWKVSTFQSGSNTWRTYTAWPPAGAKRSNLYLRQDGTLSFDPPTTDVAGLSTHPTRRTRSLTRQRPISPTYPGGDWRTWEVGSALCRSQA